MTCFGACIKNKVSFLLFFQALQAMVSFGGYKCYLSPGVMPVLPQRKVLPASSAQAHLCISENFCSL